MRRPLSVVFFVISMFLVWQRANATVAISTTEGFDVPLQTQVVSAKPDPLNPINKATLTCFRFPGFVVKQTDLGEKGASRLAIVPIKQDQKHIRCQEKNFKKEYVLNGDQGWSGYFRGAKGRYLLFDGDDGQDGGMPFAIFDALTGKRIFVDAMKNKFKTILISTDGLSLDYKRVYRLGCSLYQTEADCWPATKKETGLGDQARNGCATAYKETLSEEIGRRAVAVPHDQIVKETLEDPSVIAYNVHAVVSLESSIIKASSSDAECWLAD